MKQRSDSLQRNNALTGYSSKLVPEAVENRWNVSLILQVAGVVFRALFGAVLFCFLRPVHSFPITIHTSIHSSMHAVYTRMHIHLLSGAVSFCFLRTVHRVSLSFPITILRYIHQYIQVCMHTYTRIYTFFLAAFSWASVCSNSSFSSLFLSFSASSSASFSFSHCLAAWWTSFETWKKNSAVF